MLDIESHILTEKGEFRKIAKEYGLMRAIYCLDNTYPTIGFVVKCLVGLIAGCGIGIGLTLLIKQVLELL